MDYPMNETELEDGAEIVIRNWLELKRRERLLIVTDDTHLREAQALRKRAIGRGSSVDIMVVEKHGIQVGVFFDQHENVFDEYQAVIGAADYSLVTTRAAKRAIQRGSKFLSLPLSTNTEKSMLAYDFLKMDTKKSKLMAKIIMKYLENSSEIRVTTAAGTDLKFYKRHRQPGFFNGVVKDGRGYSSASIELYIPIEETMTSGTLILDGSYGYLGRVEQPFRILLKDGRMTEIEDSPSGKKLQEYLEQYHDERMYIAAELGIGLNSYSKCRGECYIEDESAYGTFHIGFGRNLALGGTQEASGHFDLVTHNPDIYADNRKLMERGKIILPEPAIY